MKTKSYKSLFFVLFFCGIILLPLFLFVPLKVNAEVATPCVAVYNENETTTPISKQYPYDDKGQDITLCVTGFDFENEDTVAYYYIKQGSNNIVYNYLGTVGNTYRDKNGNTVENLNRAITKNFFAEAGSGVFLIKAVILRNNEIFLFPNDLTIAIADLDKSGIESKIIITNFGVVGGEYAKYNFKVELLKNKESIDISKYQIDWYYVLNDKDHFFGHGESIEWTPDQDGDYRIKANVHLGNDNSVIEALADLSNISKNYSLYAIIVLGGVAVVLTVIVVVASIRKVKKERVW